MMDVTGIRLSGAHADVIRQAAASGYPEEVCGILVGSPAGDGPTDVVRVVPTRNDSVQDRGRRYVIPPADLVHEQRAAREAGHAIVGFYHSHPDHPAVPSGHDTDLAWPEYVYVIVAVARGIAGSPRAWRLGEDRSAFVEVPLEVADGVTRWV